jgi:hypothetical protein
MYQIYGRRTLLHALRGLVLRGCSNSRGLRRNTNKNPLIFYVKDFEGKGREK